MAFAACLVVACSGTSGPKPAPEAAKVAPPPRSISVFEDSVVLEGRWHPIEPGAGSPVTANAVRVVCRLAERSCKEDLTWLAKGQGDGPAREARDYRIEEWPKGQSRAGKLVASRREGPARVEIRVSLSGLAAVKAVIDKGAEVRWRLE